jgi:dihydroorotate dehydrogenase
MLEDDRSGSRWQPFMLTNGKRDLAIDPPWTNAGGTLGFSTEAGSLIDLSRLGAFISNPISLHRRQPAGGTRTVATPGGFLLHTGLPNAGLRTIISRHRHRWAGLPCPIILHLISREADELTRMAEMLELVDEVAGIELGLEEDDPAIVAKLVGATAARELPVLARLPFGARPATAEAALEAGAAGISFGPPRGAVPGPKGIPLQGRLYGPAVFPLALEAMTAMVNAGLSAPIMGSGGVYRRSDLQAMLDAGASGVQLDSVLWTEPEAVLGG